MSEQLHLTHRAAYLRGVAAGKSDGQAGESYRPRDGVGGEDEQRAYGLGYGDGWGEGNPCTNGTCGHLAHAAT